LLPVAAYVASVPFLGAGALFAHIVILNAPLGIIGCFTEISLESSTRWRPFILAAHGIFWPLLIFSSAGSPYLPRTLLHILWWTLVAALVMSISGCAIHLGPGLRDIGNLH
jgi:hypothetical protein